MQYANELIINMGLDGFITCVYQLIFDENGSNSTNNIQYFIMHVLGLCIKLNSYVARMFYTLSFIHSPEITINIGQNKSVLILNTNTAAMFDWGAVNLNKNKT